MDGAGISEGARVLDIACGTGGLARHALTRVGPSGSVTGLDPAAGMLAVAAETEPGIAWVQGSAEALPFEDARFDCVVSQFGMMFFQDRAKAAREMARVAEPGGSVAIAVWNSTDHDPAYADLGTLLDEMVSTAAGDAVLLPFSLSNPAVVADSLTAGGLNQIEIATKTEQASFPSAGTMVEGELRGWLPLFGIHLTDDKIAEILAEAEGRLSAHIADSGRAEFATSAHIITARKPH